MKDGFVANSKLAQAALDFGLDRYIITKPLTLQGWKPMYVEDHLQPSASITAMREMSTKTLADVVEALVGASFLDGGLPKALKCLSLFMPKGNWQGIDRTREVLYKATPENMALPPTMEHLEGLIGYTFTNKALLIEAMTHASYNVPGTHASLERLEFFGDSVVEYLVVRRLFAVNHPKPLPHWKMHLIRNALINSDIMAFLVMEASIRVERKDVLADDPKKIEIESMEVELPLWSFMRYHSSEISSHQKKTLKRFETMREPIREAIEKGIRYPWALLARLQAQKFYSDLFESLLGSIYVDSGSFDVCDQFLERIGLLPYLGRIVRNEVNCLHPKEELGKLAVAETVEYIVECHEAKEEEEEEWDDEVTRGKKTFSCKVLIGQHVAAEVDGGVSREEAKTRAAEKVIALHEGNGGMWWW
jgi:dsRNA-specific ribonuclease